MCGSPRLTESRGLPRRWGEAVSAYLERMMERMGRGGEELAACWN